MDAPLRFARWLAHLEQGETLGGTLDGPPSEGAISPPFTCGATAHGRSYGE